MSDLTPELIAEGYVPWTGGENPCRPDYVVPVVFRGGDRSVALFATYWNWKHMGGGGDIIAYKPETIRTTAITDKDGCFSVALSPGEQARMRDLLPPGDPLRVKLGEPEPKLEDLARELAEGILGANSRPYLDQRRARAVLAKLDAIAKVKGGES